MTISRWNILAGESMRVRSNHAMSAFEQADLQKQHANMLAALTLISESDKCPAILAQVAINAINGVKIG